VLFAVTGLATAAAAVQATPTAAHRAASAAHVNLRVRAAVLTKTAATTWTGKALSPQLGSGKLAVVGTVTFRSDGEATPVSVLRFRATFKLRAGSSAAVSIT
jgi:L,D-peptidoglycan transpeptidase YkuD (ErfK/YbiS/YcfS/YnhG family)